MQQRTVQLRRSCRHVSCLRNAFATHSGADCRRPSTCCRHEIGRLRRACSRVIWLGRRASEDVPLNISRETLQRTWLVLTSGKKCLLMSAENSRRWTTKASLRTVWQVLRLLNCRGQHLQVLELNSLQLEGIRRPHEVVDWRGRPELLVLKAVCRIFATPSTWTSSPSDADAGSHSGRWVTELGASGLVAGATPAVVNFTSKPPPPPGACSAQGYPPF